MTNYLYILNIEEAIRNDGFFWIKNIPKFHCSYSNLLTCLLLVICRLELAVKLKKLVLIVVKFYSFIYPKKFSLKSTIC